MLGPWIVHNCAPFLFLAAAAAQSPDAIYVNAKIVTVDSRFSLAEAMAVRDGRFTAVGKSREIRGLAGPRFLSSAFRRAPWAERGNSRGPGWFCPTMHIGQSLRHGATSGFALRWCSGWDGFPRRQVQHALHFPKLGFQLGPLFFGNRFDF